MRITKFMASDIAKAALVKQYDILKRLNNEHRGHVEDIILGEVPASIKLEFEINPKWIISASCFKIHADDRLLDNRYFYTNNYIPKLSGRYSVKLSPVQYDYLVNQLNEIERFENQLKKDREELETAIIQLGTAKRIAGVNTFLAAESGNDCNRTGHVKHSSNFR